MVFVQATVLGGLPVVAEVWFSGPDYDGEYDAGVDGLYWQRRDGSKGAPLSQKVMDRIEAKDQWWQAEVTEQAGDWLGCHCPIRRNNPEWRGISTADCPRYIEEGEYSDEYRILNPTK